MNVKKEQLDPCEDIFKTEPDEPDLVSKQMLSRIQQKCKKEHDDNAVFDEFENNTSIPEQNGVYIKQEMVECEELKSEQRSDLDFTEKNEVFCTTYTKNELDNFRDVTARDIDDTQEDNIFDESKDELLTNPCDLSSLKTENTEYPDDLAESCNSDLSQKDSPASNSKENHLELQLIDTNEKPKCQICCKEFSGISNFHQHLITHTNKKEFKCEICSKEFHRKFTLQRHLITHTDEKPFKCNICSKGFTQPSSLNTHLITHTNNKPLKCNICSKGFTNVSNMRQHLITHTNEKPFKCNICSKGFNDKSSLRRHLIIHTDKKPFKCNVCSKEFKDKSTVRKHLITHTNKKPFKCNICCKKFGQKYTLQQHIMTHSNEKPFTCNICSRKFIQKAKLKNHLMTHIK